MKATGRPQINQKVTYKQITKITKLQMTPALRML